MKNVFKIILFIVVVLTLISHKNKVYAEKERVFRLHRDEKQLYGPEPELNGFRITISHDVVGVEEAARSSNRIDMTQRVTLKANELLLAKTFEVYTADVIDSMNTNINSNIENTKNTFNGEVTALKTSIEEKEKKQDQEFEALKKMIENSLSKLPQELVSEKTKQVVQDSILNDVKKELASMKEAMKKEIIEELKKQ